MSTPYVIVCPRILRDWLKNVGLYYNPLPQIDVRDCPTPIEEQISDKTKLFSFNPHRLCPITLVQNLK
jgi:hypothetical protein